MTLKTFILLIKQSWQDSFMYRTEIYIQLIAWFISFLLYFYLWTAIFQDNETIANYTMSAMLTYFFLVQVIRNLSFSYFGFIINKDIKMGNLANMLTKPISIIPYYYALELGRNSVKFMLSMISNLAILIIFYKYFNFSSLSPASISLGALSIFPAHFINFCFVSMIGTLAFWITDANRLIFFYFATATLASGWVIPIDLFPETIQSILLYTPFPYTFYFPIKVIQGALTNQEIIHGFAVQLSYVVILGLIYKLELKKGLQKFEGVGR